MKPTIEQPSPAHAHEPPPASIRALHKRYSKLTAAEIMDDKGLLDFTKLSKEQEERLRVIRRIPRRSLNQICRIFESGPAQEEVNFPAVEGVMSEDEDDILVYEHEILPGLFPHSSIPNLYN